MAAGRRDSGRVSASLGVDYRRRRIGVGSVVADAAEWEWLE